MATPLVWGWVGDQGSGKTLSFAERIDVCLRFCESVYKKNQGGIGEPYLKCSVIKDFKLSPKIEEKYKDFLEYWSDPEELAYKRGRFVFVDEISVIADATEWADLAPSVRKWVRQLRKHQCKLYFTAQDFKTVDIAFRRVTRRLVHCRKLIGSPDPGMGRKEIKHPWGIIWKREVKRSSYVNEAVEYEYKGWIPQFTTIKKKWCDYYDTLAIIEMKAHRSLKHITKKCSTCGIEKIIHQ